MPTDRYMTVKLAFEEGVPVVLHGGSSPEHEFVKRWLEAIHQGTSEEVAAELDMLREMVATCGLVALVTPAINALLLEKLAAHVRAIEISDRPPMHHPV